MSGSKRKTVEEVESALSTRQVDKALGNYLKLMLDKVEKERDLELIKERMEKLEKGVPALKHVAGLCKSIRTGKYSKTGTEPNQVYELEKKAKKPKQGLEVKE